MWFSFFQGKRKKELHLGKHVLVRVLRKGNNTLLSISPIHFNRLEEASRRAEKKGILFPILGSRLFFLFFGKFCAKWTCLTTAAAGAEKLILPFFGPKKCSRNVFGGEWERKVINLSALFEVFFAHVFSGKNL